MKTILFYSSVKTLKQFSIQRFYRNDITLLRDLGYKVRLSKSYWDFLRFWRYDLAFIYFYRYGLVSAILSRIFLKKVIFTGGVDYLDNEYATKINYVVQKVFFMACSVFSNRNIIVSESDLKNIKKFYNTSKLALIPHSIATEQYMYNGTPKEQIITTIVWMGRAENVIRKGVDKAIKVFDIFNSIHPDYKFYIIGPKGEGQKYLANIIEGLSNKENIIFTGSIKEEEKVKILMKSKLYLQFSLYEGFGIAAMEALAAGNIVIHSGKGGLRESVKDYGILLEDTENIDIIANVLSQTVSCDQGTYSRKLAEGRSYVRNTFSDAHRKIQFANLLNELGL